MITATYGPPAVTSNLDRLAAEEAAALTEDQQAEFDHAALLDEAADAAEWAALNVAEPAEFGQYADWQLDIEHQIERLRRLLAG